MNQLINEPNQGSKNILAIVAVAIITALVVGGGVYLQQKSVIKNERNEIVETVRGEFQQEIANLKAQLSQLKETQETAPAEAPTDEEVKPPEQEEPVVKPPVDPIVEKASYIKVLSPNGGEKLTKGKMYNIKWNCPDDVAGTDVIDIYIKDKRAGDKGITSINSLPVNCCIEKYSWQIEDIPSGGNCFKIQLRGVAGSADIIDESDNYFSIVE